MTQLGAPAGACCVAVAGDASHYRLVIVTPVRRGQTLFPIEGEPTGIPTRYSVQVGWNLHLSPAADRELSPAADPQFWRFMNHSCDPSVVLRGLRVVALRDLKVGDEVTFDYHTTEYELAEPFSCRCGAPTCQQTIRGFRHLDSVARERLAPHLAPHLVEHLDRGGVPATVALPP